MHISFSCAESLSRRFLIVCADASLPCAHLACRLTGRRGGSLAEGVIFYECERTAAGDCLFGATYYTSEGQKAPLPADGARALAAFLLALDAHIKPPLRILSEGAVHCVTPSPDGLTVKLALASFDAARVGLLSRTPLLGKKISVKNTALQIYALSLGVPHAVFLEFGCSLTALRPSSIALPLSVSHLFSVPFRCVFVSRSSSVEFSLRIFDTESGELDGSSEGAGAAATVLCLLGLAPVSDVLHARMRGGTLTLSADSLSVPFSASAEARVCFEHASYQMKEKY